MTKNHILIKSVALGVLLICSLQANASVDRALVTYFNTLYKGQSPKCSIDEATKTNILSEIESKCLIRTKHESGESYISGVKSTCSDQGVKASVDEKVNALCANTAAKADIAKQQVAAQQAASQSAKQGSSSGGGSSDKSPGDLAKVGYDTYKDMIKKSEKAEKVIEKNKDKVSETWGKVTGNEKKDQTATAPAAVDTPVVDVANAPQPVPMVHKYPASDGSGGYVTAVTDESGNTTLAKFDKSGAEQPGGMSLPATASPDVINGQIKDFGADPAKGGIVNAEAQQAAKEAPATVKPMAEKATDGSTATGTDPIKEARDAKLKAEDSALDAEITAMKKQLEAAKTEAPNEANAKCNANEATRDPMTMQTKNPALEKECNIGEPQQAIICLETNLQALEAAKIKLDEQKRSCSSNSTQAEKLCSMVRSEKAQQVQQVMSLGAAVLSKVTAASEACGTTSTLSKIAQGGMMAAQGACTAMKFRCDFSCAAAKKTIELMKTKSQAIQKCKLTLQAIAQSGPEAQKAAGQLTAKLEQELAPQKSVPSAIDQCVKHKADIALMGLSALGFLSAFQDAQACKKQLASGGDGAAGKSTSGLAGPTMTTAEYCSMPNNATSITCKCTADPGADGCMGSLAKSGVNIGKIGNNGGASAFASAGQNGLGSLESMSKSPLDEELPPGANLSEAAREALGIDSAAVDSAGGAAAGVAAGSNAEAAKKAKVEEKEKAKFGFFSSLGNMLSGGKKPDHAAKATIRKYEQDQAIKRKLASDQVRAEISKASGKSNFDKIRSRYQQNAASFEQ